MSALVLALVIVGVASAVAANVLVLRATSRLGQRALPGDEEGRER
jgi:HAMP domain-containing protein